MRPGNTATDSAYGGLVKPPHIEALAALALAVRRDVQRDHGLLALGVAADHLASRSLDCHGTRLWAQVEAELVTGGPSSLSLVSIDSDRVEVVSAVRGAVRARDMIGRSPEGTLLVLLPDVDEAAPVTVATRIRLALSRMEHPPGVGSMTQRSAEDPVGLLRRHVAETAARSSDPLHRGAPPRAAGRRDALNGRWSQPGSGS